jgi:hypothetical protein
MVAVGETVAGESVAKMQQKYRLHLLIAKATMAYLH